LFLIINVYLPFISQSLLVTQWRMLTWVTKDVQTPQSRRDRPQLQIVMSHTLIWWLELEMLYWEVDLG